MNRGNIIYMKNSFLFVLVCSALFFSCSSQKKQTELLELSKPAWLKNRPMNMNYFYGIGIVSKVGASALYEEKAKERALADLAGQINTTIKSEATFYQVEDNSGIHEYLQSRIKAVSTEYLEGYEYVDKWEDLTNYYVFYKLSKTTFQEVKEKRKKEALAKAKMYYKQALIFEDQSMIMQAMGQYSNCIDLLSGYSNESTEVDMGDTTVDLMSTSMQRIENIIQGLSIEIIREVSEVGGVKAFKVKTESGIPVHNVPVRFEYTGGFLVKDRNKTDEEGEVLFPQLPSFSGKQTLTVFIDLVNMGRQVSKNLLVRKLIEKQKAAEVTINM